MPSEESRRKKEPLKYEILMVPHGEGGKKRSFITGRRGLVTMGLGVVVLMTALAVALLVYTPIVMYIPVKNPELEARYGRQILEMQQRLNELAHDVLAVRDYNQQLRKVLGEFSGKDSSAEKKMASLRATERYDPVIEDSGYASAGDYSGNPEAYGEFGSGVSRVQNVVTSHVSFRGSFPLLPPTEGFVTQGFDQSRYHYGLDYAVKRGTPVYAATDGHVLFSGWTFDDGNMIILSHGDGYLTVYKHNELLLRNVHERVKRGELIARSGSTGQTSSGPHLHFEVWKDGLPQDPEQYLLTAPKIQ